jgi:hypothetical protein
MERKIAEIEEQKTMLEERAKSNEHKLQSLREDPASGKFEDILTSLQEEKSHLAHKADQAMLEAQVCVYMSGHKCCLCMFLCMRMNMHISGPGLCVYEWAEMWY